MHTDMYILPDVLAHAHMYMYNIYIYIYILSVCVYTDIDSSVSLRTRRVINDVQR